MKYLTITLFFLFIYTISFTQSDYQVACVGFYNLENLFDTIDSPDTFDEEFTPGGKRLWTPDKYEEKIENMAFVISRLGKEKTNDGVSILGVSEIENRKVLEDLVAHPLLSASDYQIIHFDSPDRRGIDVGLLYEPKHFVPSSSRAIPLLLYEADDTTRIFTRDILYVAGKLDGESIHVLVNHWPSRRGGESRSKSLRAEGAEVCRHIVDSLTAISPTAKIIILGDLNDDPTSPSLTDVLRTSGDKQEAIKNNTLYNTMYKNYKNGLGSNAYRDSWSLFDQIILSSDFLNKDQKGYFLYQTVIFNEKFLLQKKGKYKGYPKRTFSFDTYNHGYSDHFPVFIYLIKKL